MRVADSAVPLVEGVNVTPKAQALDPARDVVHAGFPPEPRAVTLKSAAFGPVIVGGMTMVAAALVLFVRVKGCEALVEWINC